LGASRTIWQSANSISWGSSTPIKITAGLINCLDVNCASKDPMAGELGEIYIDEVLVGLNSAKAGQTVPIKWQILNEVGNAVGDLRWVKSLTSVLIECESAVAYSSIEADTSALSGLRYDTEAHQHA
jgi:hypothetical protein